MSDGGHKIRNKEDIHFVTFAVVEWVDVFTRKEYKDIVIESLKHCQKERGLQIHSWCIMSNHLHLVVSAKQGDTSDILRDFKKFTSKEIIKAITNHAGESRREWMLEIFRREGAANSRNVIYQFWRQDNQPKELFSSEFTGQKLEYIHNNPVEAGIVEKAEDYVFSSARDYYLGRNVGLLEIEFLD
jgi:REP element-mobilizing transposase RayT